ncbi:hypothetical protein [Capillimicrobium parvum]|nr:hypothetical protein [Capillimicrobium parvum]
MLRRGPLSAVLVAGVAALFTASSPASASPRTLTDCTYAALASSVAAGGTVVLDCDATIPFDAPIVVPAGRSVRLDASGSAVTFDGQRRTRLLEVSGSLTLVNLRLVNGRVQGAAGTLGTGGVGHSDAETGEPGGAGGAGTAGGDAAGGAVLVTQSGRLEVIGGALRSNTVIGGQGGTGGRGGQGARGAEGQSGWGDYCDYDTTPDSNPECWNCWYPYPEEPEQCDQYIGPIGESGGPGGVGGEGGAGGRGGPGGTASGGAIRNLGSTLIVGAVLAGNIAQGGRGGTGGPGGVAGGGGPGGNAYMDHDWAWEAGGDGGTGGAGGRAGVPGAGGAGRGGAISGSGDLTVLDSRFSADEARGGRAGTAPAPRSAGPGGDAGLTYEVLGYHYESGSPGLPGDGAPGAAGGDAGNAVGGAIHLSGGNALMQDGSFDRDSATSPVAGAGGPGGPGVTGSTSSGPGGAGGTGGGGGDARGGAVSTGGAPLRVTGLALVDNMAAVGAPSAGGMGGPGNPPGAAGAPGQPGTAADPDISGATTPTTALQISPAPVRERATVGVPYELRLSAAGGTAPYAFAVYGLPPGVSFKAPRLIRGTPTRAGAYRVHAVVTDATAPLALFGAHSWEMRVAPAAVR